MSDLDSRFKPAKKSDAYGKMRNVALIHTFLESGQECVRVEGGTRSEYEGLRKARLRYDLPVDVMMNDKGLFLVKNDKWKRKRKTRKVKETSDEVLPSGEQGVDGGEETVPHCIRHQEDHPSDCDGQTSQGD